MHLITKSVSPTNCYDCNKQLGWHLKETPAGIAGVSLCCGSSYYFTDDSGKIRQPAYPSGKTRILFPVACLFCVFVLPFLLFVSWNNADW